MAPPSSSISASDIASQLQVERAALTAFITLLENEQQALISGQIDQLLQLSDDKTRAVQALNKLSNTRNNTLLGLGATTGPDGVENWLLKNAPGCLSTWQDIQRLATQAQQTNRSNGELIHARLRNNQQALSVLHSAANSVNNLYGPDGQARIQPSGRTLGSG